MKIDQIAAIFNLLNVPKVGPQKVFKYLSNNPIHIYLLSEKSGIGVTSLLGLLLSLELKGAIVQIGGKQFVVS